MSVLVKLALGSFGGAGALALYVRFIRPQTGQFGSFASTLKMLIDRGETSKAFEMYKAWNLQHSYGLFEGGPLGFLDQSSMEWALGAKYTAKLNAAANFVGPPAPPSTAVKGLPYGYPVIWG